MIPNSYTPPPFSKGSRLSGHWELVLGKKLIKWILQSYPGLSMHSEGRIWI
jgi:hypothetical protein